MSQHNPVHQKRVKATRHLDAGQPAPGNFRVPEPVPKYFPFDGFAPPLEGENNTLIVLGRDRLPSRNVLENNPDKTSKAEIDNIYNPSHNSGNSSRQAAGAIDIVVGRGSPFPFKTYKKKTFTLGPLYNTIKVDPSHVGPLLGGSHPGYIMDAARIYISQMCKPDEYFNISDVNKIEFKNTLQTGEPKYSTTKVIEDNKQSGTNPVVSDTSAIVAKSDKIRFHARQNVKIITRGPEEFMNSQGKRLNSEDIGIHLIAGNGKDKKNAIMPQHPMLLGSNVVAAFDAVVTLLEEMSKVLNNFMYAQNNWNGKVANHMHEAGPGPTLGDFILQLQGPITQLDILTKGELPNYFGNVNIATFKTRFLSPAGDETDGHNSYICSKYNTVN